MSNYLGAVLVGAVGGLLLYLNYKGSSGGQRVATTNEQGGTNGVPVATTKRAVSYVEKGAKPPVLTTTSRPVAPSDVAFFGSQGALQPYGGNVSAEVTYRHPPAYPIRPEYGMYRDPNRIKGFN